MLIWALLSSVIFVASNIFIRFYLSGVHWLALIWTRSLGALICLSLIVFYNTSWKELQTYLIEIGSSPFLWIITLIAGFLGIWGFIKAIKLLPLYLVIPFTTLNLMTVLVSHLLLNLPIQQTQVAGVVLGSFGLFLLARSRASSSEKKGWYWLFPCMISWGLAYPLSQPLIQSTSPIFFASTMELSVFIGSTALLVPLNKIKRQFIFSTLPKPSYLGWMVSLLVLGVICDGIAREGVSPISMLAFAGLSEIGVLIMGHFFFQERLKLRQWLGACLTFIALFLILA
ncbi:MAG: DMT family transporter [Algoriphagus sp.]|nr:DMT family transporter [Algoriphagus sp.]